MFPESFKFVDVLELMQIDKVVVSLKLATTNEDGPSSERHTRVVGKCLHNAQLLADAGTTKEQLLDLKIRKLLQNSDRNTLCCNIAGYILSCYF